MEQIPVEKNKTYEIEITDLGNEGQGIGKINGFTIFIEEALPGDTIETYILKVKKRYAYGKIVKILRPSPERISPLCPISKRCGGCQLQHMNYQAQLLWKQKKVEQCLKRIGGFQDIEVKETIGAKEPFFYRNKAQFPVGEDKNGTAIGFYAKKSHTIINTDTCYIQNSVNDSIISIIRNYIDQNKIPIYNENTHTGTIRHILTRTAKKTGEIMVCIVAKGSTLPNKEMLIKPLSEIKGMSSIVLNENNSETNVILGHKTHLLWGNTTITDEIDGIQFEISPVSFFQVNPEQTQLLYQTALQAADLKGNENVLDIYCGIGTISLFFARYAQSVTGIEIIPEAVKNAKANAKKNQIHNVRFLVGKAEDSILSLCQDENFNADVVIVDPPRKGCEPLLLATIIKMRPLKIIYISCDPATLARDLKLLCEGGFSIVSVQPVDQFCQTTHIETCVLLTKIH